MTQDKIKKLVGWAALKYVIPNTFIGVGSGSTTKQFIYALSSIKHKIKGVVSSSYESTMQLKKLGIFVFDSNKVKSLDIYVDGADEINHYMQMIKGGGAALTREKIIAAIAQKFICIVDYKKQVSTLGKFPMPVEVIPMARNYVSRELLKLGGIPKYRKNTITDNGNIILDVHNLIISNPIELENKINNIAGVVTVGLFANRCADIALIGFNNSIKVILKSNLQIK